MQFGEGSSAVSSIIKGVIDVSSNEADRIIEQLIQSRKFCLQFQQLLLNVTMYSYSEFVSEH
jgi:hypothetical protein